MDFLISDDGSVDIYADNPKANPYGFGAVHVQDTSINVHVPISHDLYAADSGVS